MGSTLVWLSLALSVAFSAGQDTGTPTTKEDIPEGASTLAFVFDVTGSMYDDLVQVIQGASKILETSLNRPKKNLYNFALVPFHDPGYSFLKVVTPPKCCSHYGSEHSQNLLEQKVESSSFLNFPARVRLQGACVYLDTVNNDAIRQECQKREVEVFGGLEEERG
ncbi:Hemicentin-1, partial [Dissostichus eleginoides]